MSEEAAPLKMLPIDAGEVMQAYQRLANSKLVYRTPLVRDEVLSERLNHSIYHKLELFQQTGSFKLRGATNRLLSLSEPERQRGIVTASAGNHALGVAHAARHLDIKATIVVPTGASAAKVEALRRYPVELILEGANYDQAELFARRLERERELVYVSAYNDRMVIAGQGTLAVEILADLPATAAMLVPVGGGGLISGVGLWAKIASSTIRVIGVQSEASPAMHAHFTVGEQVAVPDLPTLADGLAGNIEEDSITLEMTRRYVDQIVLVSEAEIADAIRFYADEMHLMVEGSAAVGMAALLSNRIELADLKGPLVDLVCGRNIAPATFRKVLYG